jgi:enoyl-CoA hydratase/carnithine racemase
VLGQFEVGFAAVPGGGPSTRLPGIVGRGRAFEILLSGEDFDGELAERYGYVNRAIPDAEFVEFVNAFAERVSRFDLLALADIKRFVNAVSLPADAALTAMFLISGSANNAKGFLPRGPGGVRGGW